MALTGYQLQYKRRMKKALALRAKADRQARFLVARLATVLALGETAADHIGRINTLYGTNMSLRTDLVDGYRLAGTAVERDGAVTVLLTGKRPVPDGQVAVDGLSVLIRFRTGATATRARMLAAITEHQAAIRAMVQRPPAMGIDARRGELLILIGAHAAAGDVAVLKRRIEALTGVPVRIATTGRPGLDL